MGGEKCRACKADVVWMKTSKGKWTPVDKESIKTEELIFNPKTMTSHFATCPFASSFRKKRSKNG